MVIRIISIVVGAPLFLACVYYGGLLFLCAIMLLSLLGSFEVSRMIKRMGLREVKSYLYSGALLFPLLLHFEPSWLPGFFAFFVFSGAIIAISRFPDFSHTDLGVNFIGLLYVSFGFAHFVLLRQMEQGMLLVGYALSVIWMTDVGCFVVGTYLGKRAFLPQISPNKTVEGAVGGLIAGVAGGIGFCVFINRRLNLDNMGFLILLTPFLSAFGQLGDLFESIFKRQARVKDSSQLIPGHGGILDRFDSSLWVIPLLYHILRIRTTIF